MSASYPFSLAHNSIVPKMKNYAFQLKPHNQFHKNLHAIQTPVIHPSPLKLKLPTRTTTSQSPSIKARRRSNLKTRAKTPRPSNQERLVGAPKNGIPKWLIFGAASIGVALLFMGVDGKEAMALGPEGPLVEEFWENMRRYGLYAVTVTTGAIYTVLQPIVELLKNPVSAILVLVLLVGGFYLLSLVLSAMIGVSDFSYDYSY